MNWIARSAVFSEDKAYRLRLDRKLALVGTVFGLFGVNPSKAGAEVDDPTVVKVGGFVSRNRGGRFILGNAFTRIATDVKELASASDPVGPDCSRFWQEIIREADVIVPMWGNEDKVPRDLRPQFGNLRAAIRESGKPVLVFGLTNSGCPMHPARIDYDGHPLVEWKL